MAKAIVGVIGGSGVYDLPGLTGLREERIATPWGILPIRSGSDMKRRAGLVASSEKQ